MSKPEKVWVFDENRRVYRKDKDGKSLGAGPIWREHWREMKITGETSRSWITEWDRKIPKKGFNPRFVCFSEEEIDRNAWIKENRNKIARVIERHNDYDLLQKVAQLIGYKEEEEV